jgi:ornithine decarboxylase
MTSDQPTRATTSPKVNSIPASENIERRRIDRFLTERHPATPFVVVDLDIVGARYAALRQALPAATIYCAVKANPATEIVSALAQLGSHFDLASPGEMEICLGLHIPPERLSVGNTIKRESAVARASRDGIGLFAFDSAAELENWRAARPAPVFSAAR